jgi:long-chain acyl-CoA synthetase
VKPTVLPSVPRVYEKVHTAVQASFDEATGLKRRLIDWALGVGKRVSELKQQQKPVPAGLALQQRLADKLVYSKVKAKLGGRLRLPISGGAPLARDIAEYFHTIDIAIMEGYGQTECTTASNVNMPNRFRFGTVGPAIPGIEVRIADDGEVLVRGPNVFAGYYKDVAATREALDEDGWLRTGDIGTVDADGWLYLVDRKRDLIIVSGFNVFPAEVEDALREDPRIAEAAVVGVPHRHTGEAVKAYVVLGDGASADPSELRKSVSERLARFKVPETIEIVDVLPQSLTGKVVRRALRTANAPEDRV